MAKLTPLFDEIAALIQGPSDDLVHIERTLTDGYAHALQLESEKWRIERRIAEVAQGLQRGDTSRKARELAGLARKLDTHADELAKLRGELLELRRRADQVRQLA